MIKRVANYLTLGALVLLVFAWALLLRPSFLGGPATYIVVRGDSMLPTYQTGDLVVMHARSAYAVREIVAYRVPSGEIGAGRLVVHRIVGGDPVRGFVMKGDHNPAPDPWVPRARDIVGRAWLVGPGLGRTIAFVHQPVMAGGLAAALVVMFLLARPPRNGRGAAVDEEPDGRRSHSPTEGNSRAT